MPDRFCWRGVVDLDATLIGAHSEKEGATPNFKRGSGSHPMLALVDHGASGPGEPLAAMLRPGRATASDAADQIAVLDAALAQLPETVRPRVLVGGDTGSGVKEFLWHIHHLGLSYSVGVYGRQPVFDALAALPAQAWRRAVDTDGRAREGAQVAELTPLATGDLRRLAARDAGDRPPATPHPGTQLRITDAHGWRITLFATNTTGGRLADLEVRHRMRARAEDRIRTLKDTGLTNLPLQAFGKNEIWLELAALGYELMTWTQLLAWPNHPGPQLGTQTTTPAQRGRTNHHHRTPPHPAPESAMALVRATDQRSTKHRRPQLNPQPHSFDLCPRQPATQRRGHPTPKSPHRRKPTQSTTTSHLTKHRG